MTTTITAIPTCPEDFRDVAEAICGSVPTAVERRLLGIVRTLADALGDELMDSSNLRLDDDYLTGEYVDLTAGSCASSGPPDDLGDGRPVPRVEATFAGGAQLVLDLANDEQRRQIVQAFSQRLVIDFETPVGSGVRQFFNFANASNMTVSPVVATATGAMARIRRGKS